jgi:hypothetical protein
MYNRPSPIKAISKLSLIDCKICHRLYLLVQDIQQTQNAPVEESESGASPGSWVAQNIPPNRVSAKSGARLLSLKA